MNGAAYGEEYYSLTGKEPVTVSYAVSGSKITAADGAVGGSEVSVGYRTEENGKLIVAVYDAENVLVTAAVKDIKAGEAAENQQITIDCELNKDYRVQVMMWDGTGNMRPLCAALPVSILAQ